MNQPSSAEFKMQMMSQTMMIKNCFADCINSFNSGELSGTEKSCLANCTKREIQTLMLFGEAGQTMQARAGGMGQF